MQILIKNRVILLLHILHNFYHILTAHISSCDKLWQKLYKYYNTNATLKNT